MAKLKVVFERLRPRLAKFRELSKTERREVAEEAERMVDFAAADVQARDARFETAVA